MNAPLAKRVNDTHQNVINVNLENTKLTRSHHLHKVDVHFLPTPVPYLFAEFCLVHFANNIR